MDFFIPNILAVQSLSGVAAQERRIITDSDIAVPAGTEFQKVYFEELVKRCYREEGNFESLAGVARVYYEEYFGVGGSTIKRWKINFSRYNISLNLEENGGRLTVKAA